MKYFSRKSNLVLLETIICFLFALIVIYTYRGLFHTFFQQDEWAGYGLILGYGRNWLFQNYSLGEILAGNGRILGVPLNYFLFTISPFNTTAFTLFALLIHVINTYLVFRLLRYFTKDLLALILGTLFFGIAYTPHEAVSWFAAVTTTLPSATCLFIALLFIGTKWKKFTIADLCVIQLFLIASYLFKESSILFVVGFPFLIGLSQKWEVRKFKTIFWSSILVIFYMFYLLFSRLLSLFTTHQNSAVFVTNSQGSFARILIHAILYPISGLSQILIPDKLLFSLSRIILETQYPFLLKHPAFSAIQTIVVTDLVSLFMSILLLVFICFIYIRWKEGRAYLIAGLLFYWMSFLPFIVLDRPMSSYLSSRYYYLPAFGVALLIALSSHFLRVSLTKFSRIKILCEVILIVFFSFYFLKNIQFIERALNEQILIAAERQSFLKQIKELSGIIPDKPIFYITGDSPGYYGLANVTVPLQQGPGYTLMVWFYTSGRIPNEFLKDFYLWNIYDQGYKEVGTQGFGYFSNKEDLMKLFKTNHTIREDQIIGLSYNGHDRKITDITKQIRLEIALELQRK